MTQFFRLTFILVLLFSATPVSAQGPGSPDSIADIVEKLTPAVVNISTTQTIDQSENMQMKEFPPGHPFEEFNEFFKKFMGPQMRNQKSTSLGSGFVIAPDGFIVTNNHVVERADEIDVTFGDDTQYKATVVGKDTKTDLALLKIDAGKELPYVNFGDSDISRVGDWVIVIGNPFGLGGTVTTGIISARARDINAGPFDDFIQTDAAINRGNSGGPMFNMKGEVIGINTAIYSPNGVGNVGIGFAVPSSMASPIIEQLKEKGEVKRGWLGVRIQNVTEEIAETLDLEEAKGALVAEVIADSPAEKAGVKTGDVVIKFDGMDIPVMKKLPRFVAETPIGKNVGMEVIRDGKVKSLRVEIGELKEEEVEEEREEKKEEEGDSEGENVLGMKLSPISNSLRKKFSIGDDVEGLVVTGFEKNSPAMSKGIINGSVIVEANRKKLKTVKQFRSIIEEAKRKKFKSALLLVNRAGDTLFVAIPISSD